MDRFLPATGTFTSPHPWVDLHAHVLPCIDDGPKTWEEALQMVDEAEEIGVTHIVATPHYNNMYTEKDEVIFELCREMNERISEAGKEITILPGREVSFTDTHIDELLRSGGLRSPSGSTSLLIELPEGINKETVIKGLFSIMLEGLRVIIAHPERNMLLQTDTSIATELRERGTYMQLDARSLLGTHGPVARKAAERMLYNRDVDIISSDAHRAGDYFEYAEACRYAMRFTEAAVLSSTLSTTPTYIAQIDI